MNRFLQLGANKKGRDFVIGDIHGKYDLLMLGLKRVEFDFECDRLIAVGDLVDRGPKNMEVLRLIGEPWFYTVIGNHEMMMAEGVMDKAGEVGYGKGTFHHWVANGGSWYFKLWDMEIDELKETFVPLIRNDLPLAIEFIAENGKRVGVCHAGLPKTWTWTETRKGLECLLDYEDTLGLNVLWTRDRIGQRETKEILGIDLLVNGHTPTKKEVWKNNNVFIDQGAHNPYQLTPLNVMDLFDRMEK